jgi:hypothetical protein
MNTVSSTQIAWEASTEMQATNKQPNYDALFALFQCAISNKLKFPKLRFQLPNQVLVVKLAGDKSKYTGDIMLTNDAGYGSPNNKYFGRIEARNSGLVAGRDLTPEIEQLLQRIAVDPIGVAAELGKLSGNCVFCSKPLFDKTGISQAHGYGPVCAKKYGLPWSKSDVKASNKPAPAPALPALTQAQEDAIEDAIALAPVDGLLNADGYRKAERERLQRKLQQEIRSES